MSDNHCPECGAVLLPNAEFCRECGLPVESTSAPTVTEQTSAFGIGAVTAFAKRLSKRVLIIAAAAAGGVPRGDGSWLYDNGSIRISAEGEWKNGALYDGTVNVTFNGSVIGNVRYSDGKWDTDDYKAFCEAADSVNFANAFK